MKNEKIIEIENFLHGCRVRLKELHYNAPSYSLHKIIDDFEGDLREFDDNIMEDAQSIFGFIEAGTINPQLPESVEIEALLVEIRNKLAEFKESSKDAIMWTGVMNCVDDFWHTLNKTIYLIKIAKKDI